MFSENIETTVAKTFVLASPKGDVGIEIETEGRNLPAGRVTQTFQGKEDGSLRNGMEYVSKPIPAKLVEELVNNLAGELVARGAGLDPSYRSSTHIHVNYCDYRWRDVLGTMVAWAIVEPLVFSMMPPGRDGSLFCVSSYDSGDLPAYMERLCGEVHNGFNMGFHPRGKYSSLNLTRLSDLGTMEYRIFPTSVNGAQIQTWVDWLMDIRDMVQKHDDPSFLTLVRDAEQRPMPFLERIFGTADFPQAQEYVDFGARQGFEIARVIGKYLKRQAPKTRSKSIYGEAAAPVAAGVRGGDVAPVMVGNAVEFRIVDDAIPQIGEDDRGDGEVAPAWPVAGFQRRARRNAIRRRPAGGAGRVGGIVEAVEGGARGPLALDPQIARWRRNQEAYRRIGDAVLVEAYQRRIDARVAELAQERNEVL